MDLFSTEMTTFKWILRILLWAFIFFGVGCLFVRRENRNKLYAFIAAWALHLSLLVILSDFLPPFELIYISYLLSFFVVLFLIAKIARVETSKKYYIVSCIMAFLMTFLFFLFAFEARVIGYV